MTSSTMSSASDVARDRRCNSCIVVVSAAAVSAAAVAAADDDDDGDDDGDVCHVSMFFVVGHLFVYCLMICVDY